MANEATAYESKGEEYFAHGRHEVLPLLKDDCRAVIDIGGATGATLSLIKDRHPAIRTFCVDSHQPSLEIAKARGHATIRCDLDRVVPEVIADCDVVLCLDVLEHLLDPWSVLARIYGKMRPGSRVIISLPNVRYLPLSAALLFRGKWELADAGILDRTHLRFFTRGTAIELVSGAGFAIETVGINMGLGRRGRIGNALTFGFFRDLLAFQYLIVGSKR